jgi:hypothetical protein
VLWRRQTAAARRAERPAQIKPFDSGCVPDGAVYVRATTGDAPRYARRDPHAAENGTCKTPVSRVDRLLHGVRLPPVAGREYGVCHGQHARTFEGCHELPRCRSDGLSVLGTL